jgi:uncharacterized protein
MSVIVDRYRHPVVFYVIATAAPWALWIAAGLISHRQPPQDSDTALASILAFLGLLAPAGAAIALTWRSPELRGDVLGRLTLRGVTPFYGAAASLLLLASILLAQAISLLFGYDAGQFIITGQFSFTSGVFPVWLLLIGAPIIEELAWHTYGTDTLRRRFSLFTTCLIFGVYWALWHIPLASIKGYYQSNIANDGAIYAINFLVSVIPFVILMNWLYYKTKRNILVAIVFHISANFFNEIFATHPDSKIIQTGLLLLLSAALVLRERRFFFDRDTSALAA